MATIEGSQTVTVSTIERVYTPSWVSQYANELKQGNTATKKLAITGGSSIMRVKHDAAKGIERHIISVEDRITNPEATAGADMHKIQVTITCPQDAAASEAATLALAEGVLTWLLSDGILDSVMQDVL